MVVVADKELTEACVALGVFGQIVLVTTVVLSLEGQLDRGLFFFVEAFQRIHLDNMREALQQDGGQHCGDADKLYDEMRLLVHGSESEIDEGVEVGNAERAGGEDQQYEADGKHGPRETFGIMVGEDGVL